MSDCSCGQRGIGCICAEVARIDAPIGGYLACQHCGDYKVNWGGQYHVAQTEIQAQAWVDQHAIRCHRRLDRW